MSISVAITLVSTNNSVYQYSRVHGETFGTLVCLTGTNIGKAFPPLSQDAWERCYPVVGRSWILTSKKTGKEVFRTSKVEEIKIVSEVPTSLLDHFEARQVRTSGTPGHEHPLMVWDEGLHVRDLVEGCPGCAYQAIQDLLSKVQQGLAKL